MIEDFWDERDELKHIRDFARSRRANPMSTLGVALVRATCMIPPNVVLPPIVGGRTAPNLFAALVGESGGGKGASERAGRDAIRYVVEDPDLPEFSPGSGEGIARTLMQEPTALFVAAEIDTLAALFGRKGSTLEAELRKLYMGDNLGFANANANTRTKVEALSYRAGLIVGVQPLRAGVLLNGDGGTAQRFLWVSTRDVEMPDERPEPMDPLDVYPSPWPREGLHDLKVPGMAFEEMDRQQVDTHRGEPGIDPLDGHALLTRLKVAAALMVLAGRGEVGDDDWDVARRVMLASKWTRTDVQRAVERQRRRQVVARAAETAEREEYGEDRKLGRCRDAILRHLGNGWTGGAELRRKIRVELRGYFGEAIAQLTQDGVLQEADHNRGKVYLRAGMSVHPVHPVHPNLTSEDTGVRRGVPRTPHNTPSQPSSWENTPTEPEPVSEPDDSVQTPHPPPSKHNGAKLSPDCTGCGRYPSVGNLSFPGLCAVCITKERSRR